MENMLRLLLSVLLVTGGSFQILSAQDGFYSLDKIQEIKINFEHDNWRYLLDSLRYNGEELLLGAVAINGETMEDAGVRYRDGRGFTPAARRNGLYIQLDQVKSGQQYQGYHAINLSSAIRDPSLLREVMGFEIARDYMPAPLANYARVYINDEYYGLFVNIETIGEAFLQRNFGHSDGMLFMADPNQIEQEPEGCKSKVYSSLQQDNGTACLQFQFKEVQNGDWSKLEQLTDVLNTAPEKLEEILDVDKSLWMLAFNNLTVNLASYTGQFSPNYYLYMDEKGRFVPILSHLNLAFGSYKNTGMGSDLGTGELLQLDPLLHADTPDKPLISVLLGNELYQKNYLAHIRLMFNEHFRDDAFARRASELQARITEALEEDENKYYSMKEVAMSRDEVIGKKSKIPGIVDFMEKRAAFLEKHPAFTVVPPEISEVSVRQREKFSNERVTDFKIQAKADRFTLRMRLLYRFDKNEDFAEAVMLDDGKSADGEADDGIYGVAITPPAGAGAISYYILAENARAVSYDPPNYTYELRSATLSELNK